MSQSRTWCSLSKGAGSGFRDVGNVGFIGSLGFRGSGSRVQGFRGKGLGFTVGFRGFQGLGGRVDRFRVWRSESFGLEVFRVWQSVG